jgi:type II secretory pathway component GspD/PulD (secretin)
VTPRLRTYVAAGLLLILPVAGEYACADTLETRIIQLKHRDADDVLPALLPLLDRDGRISGRQYQLFVRTSDRNFTEIERVLKEIDTPLRNLRITVRHSGSRNTTASELEVSAERRLGTNSRIVLTPTTPARGGLVVRREGADGSVQLQTQQHSVVRSQDDSQFISVVEGRRAYIAVGVALPQVQAFLVLAGNRLTLVSGVTYHNVSTGFEVLPRMSGDEVDLEITPRVAFFGDRGSQTVTFSELSTHVRVKTGEWVDLGDVLSNANQVGRTILGTTANQSQARSSFQVRVDQ